MIGQLGFLCPEQHVGLERYAYLQFGMKRFGTW